MSDTVKAIRRVSDAVNAFKVGGKVRYSQSASMGGFDWRIIQATVVKLSRHRVRISFDGREAWVTPERLTPGAYMETESLIEYLRRGARNGIGSRLGEAANRIEELEAVLLQARCAPLGDNHHNAVACPYCNPERREFK